MNVKILDSGSNAIFTLQNSGIFTLPLQSGVTVQLSSDQSIPGIATKLLYNTVVGSDAQNEWDDSNYRFVVTQAGIYLIGNIIRWASAFSSGELAVASIYRAGSALAETRLAWARADANPSQAITIRYPLSVDDYIEFYAYVSSTETVDADYSFGWLQRVA